MFDRPPREREWVSWLYVVLWSVVILLTIPFARALSSFVRDSWGAEIFRDLVLSAIVLGIGAGLLLVARYRRNGRENYLWLILTGLLFAYFTMGLQASPEESLHFVEYGVLGVLAFRALVHRTRDSSIYLAAIFVVSVVGTFDEIIQWLTPRRVFDYRDIGFNVLGGVLAQIGVAKGVRPVIIEPVFRPSGVRRICRFAAAELVLLGLCLWNTPVWTERLVRLVPAMEYVLYKPVAMSEYGYRIEDPEIGILFSRFKAEELSATDAERATEAARILDEYTHPDTYSDFLRKYSPATDPFLHELRVHLFRRDHYRSVAWKYKKNRMHYLYHNMVAYRENQIVEKYFAHTLGETRHWRLDDGHKAYLEENMDKDRLYVSGVSRGLITSVSQWQMLLLIALGLVVTAGVYAYNGKYEKRGKSQA